MCTRNRLGGIRILVRTQLRSPLYSGERNAGAHAHGDSSAADPYLSRVWADNRPLIILNPR